MSGVDQCPTTHGEKALSEGKAPKPTAAELARTARELPTVQGKKVWRSLEEWSDSPEFRDHLEKEFPYGAVEMHRAYLNAGTEQDKDGVSAESRRDFLKIMGASMALAGVAVIPGCRRPEHKILAYGKDVPEEMIPGKPLFYATSFPRPGGGADGLVVETHEGRPTKIEGNPLHPMNRGRVGIWPLASILSLYDVDRPVEPRYRNPARKNADGTDPDTRLRATWDDFRAWAKDHFTRHAPVAKNGDDGAGLAFIVEKKTSPTRDAMKRRIMAAYPKAAWVAYDPAESMGAAEGTRLAFGAPMRELYNFSVEPGKETTKVIVSLDKDFVCGGADEISNARGFAATRRVMTTKDPMSRLYVVESGLSQTGAQADHRVRLSPSQITAFAVEFAKLVIIKCGSPDKDALLAGLGKITVPAGLPIDSTFLHECANDVADATNREKTLIVAGPSQPPEVHAIAALLNGVLGNIGKAVSYVPMEEDEADASMNKLAALAASMNAGKVQTLVCIDANPMYACPGDVDFSAAFAKVPATITLSASSTETARESTWSLNGTHYLESWGDVTAHDGTVSAIQPMIAPLYAPAMSEIELLALVAGGDFMAKVDGYDLVREAWGLGIAKNNLDKVWRRSLHDGVVAGSTAKLLTPSVNSRLVMERVSAMMLGVPEAGAIEVAFTLGQVHDGRFGNCSWLHELPQQGTRVVWDNPVLLSPKTAHDLGVLPKSFSGKDSSNMYTKEKYPSGRVVEIDVQGRKVKMAAWILPGMADNTALVTLGYGRRVCGLVGDGVGFDAYPLWSSTNAEKGRYATATLKATEKWYEISSTQNHWSMEGRTSIVRAVDLPAWQEFGEATAPGGASFYRKADDLSFAERLGELGHAPPNESIYVNPYNNSREEPAKDSTFSKGPQWGMTIDLSTCTGCGACTVACQSENNIPVVGKKEVAKGREMTWIRVDRYYIGDDFNNPDSVYHQPVACVHCENAPCEVVCPVNATVHGPEGINYMVYNRCIGTRYCANNCPYKVRRFNFFEYGKLQFNGNYMGKELLNDAIPERGGVNGSNVHNKLNINLIPPRLREKIAEIERMGKNPNVSVRMRGIMEKCTYCVQRINAARIEAKLHDMRTADGNAAIPDGMFQVACQQACPSESIVFGDILDVKSKVHATRANPRSYKLLNFLNTRPRTSHMVRVSNPNPKIREAVANPFHHGAGGGGHGGGADSHGKPGEGGHTFFDRTKRHEDDGYRLSLGVFTASEHAPSSNGGRA
jgi:MoCo/4Fe-4S cofactor protein with predicted Tat translocation signal